MLLFKIKIPNFFYGKGEALVFLIRYTKFQKTPSIFSTIYSLYNDWERIKFPPGHISQTALTNKNAAKKELEKLGYSESDMKKEYDYSLSEYEKHNPKIKFFIDNFLSLSEHALYCRCKVSADDDLTIGFHSQTTTDKKLLKLEMYLNRMKSEFSLARNLYYEFHTTSETENLLYLEFNAGIIDGVNMEKLRTSFRLCFGVLDKIANGICYLLDIPKLNPQDFIYFHSFWFKDNADEQRKNILNSRNNVYLTSLFCIASDLFYKDGVLAFYKEWRNELEHGSLLVRKNDEDPYNILDNKLFPIITSPKDFEDKTKKVLQLTRAAIFSFAYCVREELFTAETFNR